MGIFRNPYILESSIPLASAVYILASSGSRTENMLLLTTAAAATLFPSFEPSVYKLILGCFECLNSANFCLNTRGFVSFFLNSDKEVSTSGLINFQGGVVELDTGFIVSKG